MSTSTLQAETTIIETTPLTGHDRCDADATRVEEARVRLIMPSGNELLLCKHHFEAHEAKLIGDGARVDLDNRADLLPKPYDPATDNS